MAKEQGLFRHPFCKGRKTTEIYHYHPVHIVYQTAIRPQSCGIKLQKPQTKQPSFNCLFSWRIMDVIKLEMDQNGQFEMIKYSPRFVPHLSDAALDGLHITNSLPCFSSSDRSSIICGDVLKKSKQPVRRSPWEQSSLAAVDVNKASPRLYFHHFDGFGEILIASAISRQSFTWSERVLLAVWLKRTCKGVWQNSDFTFNHHSWRLHRILEVLRHCG